MHQISSSLIAVAILGSLSLPALAQESFQEKFNQLSPAEQAMTRAEAVKKESYDQMPAAPRRMNEKSVEAFCKLLPRGLETSIPEIMATRGEAGLEHQRTLLWARYISCHDSVLYYEGHRFFKSGVYTDSQLRSAIGEINKVIGWLKKQEQALETGSGKFANVR